MIMEFKTKANRYGHRNYLRIDTDKKEYSTFCHKMIVDGMEIKEADRRILIKRIVDENYTENDRY